MSEKEIPIILGTRYGTEVQRRAALHAEAKAAAEKAEAEQAKLDLQRAKLKARIADLAMPGATADLMQSDAVDQRAVEIAAAELALNGDLGDLAPAHGSKGATRDQVE